MNQGQSYADRWGTWTLITAELAHGKHRSGLHWVVLGLSLGPVATSLLVAALPQVPTWSGRWRAPSGSAGRGGVASEAQARSLMGGEAAPPALAVGAADGMALPHGERCFG